MNFTDKQLANFKRYVKVQMGGRYNMFDPNARALTGLTKEEYLFVMKNYVELKEAAEKEEKK